MRNTTIICSSLTAAFYVLFRVLFMYLIFLYCFLLFICVRLTRDLINATYLLTYNSTEAVQ